MPTSRLAAIDVAALYVERGGPYFTMPRVDPWGVERDARRYAGPHSIVAHPPCGPWGDLRHLYKGDEHACAPAAVEMVRARGGVLEHPHRSKLWAALDMPAPGNEIGAPGEIDRFGGFCVVLDQVSWGHVAQKRTRLYFCGVEPLRVTSAMRYGGTPTHWVCGSRNPRASKGSGGVPPPGIKFCSSAMRRRTPPAFADWLVELAATAVPA